MSTQTLTNPLEATRTTAADLWVTPEPRVAPPAPAGRGNGGRAPGPFKRLLVAVDESEQAAAAADAAARLAGQLGADVILLNVFWADAGFTPELGFVAPDLRAAWIATGDSLLHRLAGRMPHGIRVEQVLREGDPVAEIVAAALLYDADLIVMGTHGRGRLAQAVLGSVAAGVTRRAGCPVLTVAHPAPGTAVPGAVPAEEAAADAPRG